MAAQNVAVATKVKGKVEVLTIGKTAVLAQDAWVTDGAVVRTSDKSFVKLVFVDKSQINIGPNSEMKIEKFSGKDSGVIDLVKGKIRSQVTKDYLQNQDKDKSKLFVKTPNAVMGIRGTDFMISTNGTNTAAVLFEGEVAFNKLESTANIPSSKLEDTVNGGVRMHPGEFSVMEANRPEPTDPSRLNVQQLEALEKNTDFGSDRSPSHASSEPKQSVVPAGLSGQSVSNTSSALKTEVAQVASNPATESASTQSSADPNGYVSGDSVKPANGSFVHIESGTIIPPAPGSILDTHTNTYIPSPESGSVASDGSYVPPENVEITVDGKILVTVTEKDGTVKTVEVPKPSVVVTDAPVATGTTTITMASLSSSETTVKNDILNAAFTPNALNDFSNLQRNATGGYENGAQAAADTINPYVNTTIRVSPQ